MEDSRFREKISTKNLVLEPLSEWHFSRLYKRFANPALYRFIDRSAPSSEDAFLGTMRKTLAGAPPESGETWRNWVALDREENEIICYLETTQQGGNVSFGYYCFPPFQGFGYTKEALQALMDLFNRSSGPEKFVIECDCRNLASAKIACQLGFSLTETTDHAGTIHGVVSHEFRFEKLGGIRIVHQHVSSTETLFFLLRHGEETVSAQTLQVQKNVYLIRRLKTDQAFEKHDHLWQSLLEELLSEIIQTCDRGSEKNPVRFLARTNASDPLLAVKMRALAQSGFAPTQRRIEYTFPLKDLAGDQHQEEASPISWESLKDTSESNLRQAAQLMEECAQGDPDFSESDDALMCIRGYLCEPGLSNSPQCIQLGTRNGRPAAVVIAQVESDTGWSRITYMGLVPAFRRKGLGKWVHSHGVQMMKDQGGLVYHGGTLVQNRPMVRLFERLNGGSQELVEEWEQTLG